MCKVFAHKLQQTKRDGPAVCIQYYEFAKCGVIFLQGNCWLLVGSRGKLSRLGYTSYDRKVILLFSVVNYHCSSNATVVYCANMLGTSCAYMYVKKAE